MWQIIEKSSLEDETISNAFSARGIFKILSDEEVTQSPRIQATLHNGQMVLSIDKNIVLFENELVASCNFLNFNVHVDVIAISSASNLIVVGLQDGEIHGIHIKGMLLFNLCIRIEDVKLNGRTFVNIQQVGKQFYLTCSNGSLYRLSEIDETALDEVKLNMSGSDNDTVTCNETLFEHVKVERIVTERNLSNLCAAVMVPSNADNALVLTGTQHALYCIQTTGHTNKINLPDMYNGVKRIFNLDNYILVLTNSGHLLQLCPYTKILCLRHVPETVLIDECVVMECTDENIELLVLTKIDCKHADERTMKIIQYPSMRCLSQIDVPFHSWLVQQPKSCVNLYYLSAKQQNLQQFPTEVEMMLVSETEPGDRFKKLIAKGHLEEAEDFGKQFELSLQPIYEAKAKRILVELCCLDENNPELLQSSFDELLTLLAFIENKEFFKHNRMMSMPSRKLLNQFLQQMLKHFDKELDEEHIVDITEQLHRLETLAIIDPYECNMEWQKFVYHPNLVEIVITLFKMDFATACLLWKRHVCAIIPRLDGKELYKLLSLIPANTEAFNVVQWLRQFVPTVSNSHPNMMPLITDWTIEKTKALQYAEYWPEIGLEFSTKVLEIFEEIQFLYSDMRRQHERNIGRLRDLVNTLQELSVLKKTYKLTFTLDNYAQESLDSTALCILQRVHLDDLKSLVNDFLYPIFQERGQLPVIAIRQYISLLVANRKSLSTWLERAVACIELLHNEDDRLECAVLVLKSAPVPWPDMVAPLIKLRYSTHPLAQEISTEYELQAIKIMKVKYGWPADSAVDINMELFMHRIVKLDLPDMLDDIRTLVKVAPEIAMGAYFNCCYQLVRRDKLEMAYEFFKTLHADKSVTCTAQVVELFADILDYSAAAVTDQQQHEQEQLIEFYTLIARKCQDEYHRKCAHAIRQRFTLRQKYRLSVGAINELSSHKNRMKLLESGIDNIIERSQASVNVYEFVASEVRELCAALNVERVQGMRRMCARLNCLPLSCALAFVVLESVDCVQANQKDFIDLALELLSQQMQITHSTQAHNSKALLPDTDPLAFPLAYALLVRAAIVEHQPQACALTELLKYVRIARSVYNVTAIEQTYSGRERDINEQICKALEATEIVMADTTLNYTSALNSSYETKPTTVEPKKRYSVSIFDTVDLPAQQPIKMTCHNEQLPIVKFIARTLLLLVVITEQPKNALLKQLRDLLPSHVRDDVECAREDFFLSLEELLKTKKHDIWYTVAQYLLDYQRHNECNILNCDFISLQLSRVLKHLLNHKHVNFTELFVMLIGDDHAEALLQKLETDARTDQQKANLLTLIEMYNAHMEETQQVELIRNKRIKHFYYMEFCKQDPSIKGKFNADIDNIEQLLKAFHNKQLDVHLLERMSRDFNLDHQQLLITQVISILNAQELQYEIKTDAFGDEELVMLSSVAQMRDLCQPYINEIKNTELLASRLIQFIQEINIYFYELYLCVIELLMFIDAAPKEMHIWNNILHFLKHKMIKRRRNRPGQLETDIWQSDLGVLPKIARYRLPFKPIVEQPLKDILDNELCVDNCESWFPLIRMHTMLKGSTEVSKTQDYYCMSAVKNSIVEYKSKYDSETWHLQPTNNAFLKSILRLVRHINSPSKAFMVLYFVSNYAPEGADQVEAAFECYKYSLDHEQHLTGAQEQLLKIRQKYPTLKTQHLLYVYGLVDDKLMHLVRKPTELIYNLYNNDLILKCGKLDINAVVKEIAELHNLDVEVMQFQLLQKWLAITTDSNDGTMLEETFFEEQHLSEKGSEDVGNATENVIRANYILNSWPKKKALQFLVAHIFPSDGSINTSKQLQMYECFSKLNDGNVSFEQMLNQRQYVAVKCVHELKQLGYNCSLEKFSSCNKIEMLKLIWQRNAQDPHALVTLANICLGYDISITQIWNGILRRMVRFNMVLELNALVDMLSCQPRLLHTEGLCEAWECVLMQPFKNANQTRSFEQEDLLHKALFRLQSCPVLHKLKLTEFAERCMLLKRPHMAAVLLGLCKCETQREEIKNLVISHANEKLRKEIMNLEDAGILSVILNFVLKELNL